MPYPPRRLGRRGSDNVSCAPPADSAGFIYGSYRAATTEAHRDEPYLNSSHQEVTYVSSSVGGSVSTLSFEDRETRDRISPRKRHGGGVRDKVKGFSRASRRNLLRCLASINRDAFRSFKGRLFFVTLTYPAEFPEDPEVCKMHLKAFRKRLQREYGAYAAFWRLGIQRRGAWHFHLLLFAGPSVGRVKELRTFVSSCWYEICGEVSEGHLRAGTRVEAVKKWRQATSYAELYMAKEEVFPKRLETGRIWGIWNEELLPVRWETVEVSLREAYKIRRVYRKLARGRVPAPYAASRCS